MSQTAKTTVIEGTLELAPKEEAAANLPARVIGVTPTPADLLSMALTQGADLDRLERLMALQTEWEAKQAKNAFTAAMASFKSKQIDVYKNKLVSFPARNGGAATSYMHAELSDLVDAVTPGMAENGLYHDWDVEQLEGGAVRVTCVVTHVMGHSKRVTLRGAPDNTGNKNSIQQVGSTMTYLQRYTLQSALGIATKGQDDDGRGAGVVVTDDHGDASGAAQAANPERDKIVMDLYACADNGMAELLKAWKGLTEKARTMVGIEFAQIKKHAQRAGA